MQATFLLISHREKSTWPQYLAEVLVSLGVPRLISEDEIDADMALTNYDLIIVDATTVENIDRLIFRILARNPQVRIVVVTLTPSWREARAVLRSGAVDYLSGALTKKEFSAAIEEALNVSIAARS